MGIKVNANTMIVYRGSEIKQIIDSQEKEILRIIKDVYALLADKQDSEVPFSSFLTFPKSPENRIIALPAFLGGSIDSAGIKWIASFPNNITNGMDRASAILVLNDLKSGRPKAFMESSIISAIRTAASAALIAKYVCQPNLEQVSLIGCGPINFNILNYLQVVFPQLDKLVLFDINNERIDYFENNVAEKWVGKFSITKAKSLDVAIELSNLISFATNVSQPYLNSLGRNGSRKVLLNISLRDITPEIIQSSYNIVDDPLHVNKANTSIHLTYKITQNLNFVNAKISDFVRGEIKETPHDKPIVISPFGLGGLDIALGEWIYQQAIAKCLGSTIEDFFPDPY